MLWIGITGGIAAGKSTVTRILRTLGYEVLDADEISRQVTSAGGAALVDIFKTFGESVRNSDGSLNRRALGEQVFGRVEEMKKLEAIVHPLVREKVAAEKIRLKNEGKKAAFYDVPLLFEKNMEKDFDAVVLVYCEPEQQVSRLIARNGLSKEEAEIRIKSQIPMKEKKSRTPYVIRNTKDLSHLENEVKRVLAELKLI